MVPSPKVMYCTKYSTYFSKFQEVGTYDHKPEMNAAGVGEKVWTRFWFLIFTFLDG
jgi:hypothetical protein